MIHSRDKGFGLIEIIIVTAIVSAGLFAFSQVGTLSLRLLRNEKETLEMSLLAQESLEAVRSVRDDAWSEIAWRTDIQNPSLPYYPVISGGKWTLSATSPGLVNNKYSRFVIFEKAYRNAADQLIVSPGTEDPGTRKVIARTTTTIRTVELAAYITDFQQFVPRPSDVVAISYAGAATDADLGNFPSNNAGDGDPGQTFTTLASSIKVSKVSLLLRRTTAAPSNIYVELRPGPTDSALGASTAVTGASIPDGAAAWIDFPFAEPVFLASLTNYTIRLRSIPDSTAAFSGSAGTVNWLYTQSASSPYAGGVARRYIGRLSNPTDPGQQMDQYDFGFKVYAVQ